MRHSPSTEKPPPTLERESNRAARQPDRPVPSAAPPRRRRVAYIVIVTTILLLAGIWRLNHRPSAGRGAGAQARGGGRFGFGMAGPMPVMVQPAAKGDLHLYLNGLGTVTPTATVTVRTQISGQLVQVAFTEGQTVKRGDLLALIDPRPYEVALQQASGQLQQAQAQQQQAQLDLQRYEQLAQQDSISKQQVDTARSQVNQYAGAIEADEAAIHSAQLNLAYCHITAPFDGRVGLRLVDPGNYVTPGDAGGLVVLSQMKPITVLFSLPEDDISQVAARLHSGAALPVEIYDRAQTRKLATGTLTSIDNQIDSTTGTFRLRATFDNSDESLFPNQFVNVRLLVDTDRDATVIPTSAVERGQQGTFVYVVNADSTVSARTLTLGPSEGERVAVLAGLAPGERIVVDGADRLRDGAQVIVQGSDGNTTPGERRSGRRRSGSEGEGSDNPDRSGPRSSGN